MNKIQYNNFYLNNMSKNASDNIYNDMEETKFSARDTLCNTF